MDNLTIEVCCSSVSDALEAYKAGADRIELCCAIENGGLTPSAGEYLEAALKIDVPIVVLIRPRFSGFDYDEDDFGAMLQDAKYFVRNGADGIAFGFLDKQGTLDKEKTLMMIEACGNADPVFHKAFDCLEDPFDALEYFRTNGIKRVLTAGGCREAVLGAEMIRAYVDMAGADMIAAAGRIRPENALKLLSVSGVSQIHFALNTSLRDMSASFNEALGDGFSSEGYTRTDPEALSNFIKWLRTL